MIEIAAALRIAAGVERFTHGGDVQYVQIRGDEVVEFTAIARQFGK